MPTPLTRAHLEAIAAVLRHHDTQFGHPTAPLLAHDMAAVLRLFNPAFDKAAFIAACDPGQPSRARSTTSRAVSALLGSPTP